MSDTFEDLGVEIELEKYGDFRKVREMLTRIGVASTKTNTLYQSCHILHKRGKYAIMHFKELFILDGKVETTKIEESDYARRNAIIKLLEAWGMITVLESDKVLEPILEPDKVTVLSEKESKDWVLVAKYTIGKKKKS